MAEQKQKKPNILVIFGDDIGMWNVGAYTNGMMGRTLNIDRIAKEGILFTDHYGQPSCTAGRASFIMGQCGLRTRLTKVGLPGAALGMRAEDPTIAELLKPLGYATGQFGKNHLGDRDEHLPTMHGFDEFFGNLYHLNAEEEPELRDYPPEKDFPNFKKNYGPRGVLHCWADPLIPLRVPKIYNLRTDPYEHADVTSNTYYDWLLDHIYLLVPAQAIAAEFLATFKEFPPRQKAASFSLDQVVDALTAGTAGER